MSLDPARRTPTPAPARPPSPARLGSTRACLLALALAGGCRNPFRPTEPEPPAQQGTTVVVQIDYATPDGLLQTIAEAVFAKAQGNGTPAYIGAFADTLTDGFGLVFTFDPDVVADRTRAGKVIPAWTRDREQEFYRYLSARDPDGEYSLLWTTVVPAEVDESAGTATLHVHYSITAAASGGAVSQVALGQADIALRRVVASDRWVITRWDDHLDPQTPADPADPGQRSFSRLRIDSTGQ